MQLIVDEQDRELLRSTWQRGRRADDAARAPEPADQAEPSVTAGGVLGA